MPPVVERRALVRTLPARLFLLTSVLLGVLSLAQHVLPLPGPVDLFRKGVTLGWLAGIVALLVLTVVQHRHAFLWRVRRKLILSYVFLGVVPVVLIMMFVLAGGVLLYVTVASYVFQEGYADTVEDVRQIAETSALEIGRSPAVAQAVIERKYTNAAGAYPALSLAFVPTGRTRTGTPVPPGDAARAAAFVASGPWAHGPPPTRLPTWVPVAGGFVGTLVVPSALAEAPMLVIRATAATRDGTHVIVVDLPLDAEGVTHLRERTGAEVGAMAVTGCGVAPGAASAPPARNGWSLFRETVAFVECIGWSDGRPGTVSVTIGAPVASVYERLASVNSAQFGTSWTTFLVLLLLLAGLFLIIQGSALVIGGLLARSITSAVHELFVGTERIQQGDFAHRIPIGSRDQLGDLAESFNRMSTNLEHLLQVRREKQRLDDELRIARDIQQSLLPTEPPQVDGLDIADLCEPAREVGGDYYDFFHIGPRQLGVLIADVSGKGTSAALYMAELKGLMLALSRLERSPRQLLINLNGYLCEHLDNRSFITMTYAVFDLEARTLTLARAGHTPLLVVSGGQAELLAPDGMVLGLRFPGAADRFESLLVEHTRPLRPGDVVVLYTDGVTEATDTADNLFGDEALVEVVRSQHRLPAAGIRERVLREVKAFVGDAEPHDDMTMVVVRMTEEEHDAA